MNVGVKKILFRVYGEISMVKFVCFCYLYKLNFCLFLYDIIVKEKLVL